MMAWSAPAPGPDAEVDVGAEVDVDVDAWVEAGPEVEAEVSGLPFGVVGAGDGPPASDGAPPRAGAPPGGAGSGPPGAGAAAVVRVEDRLTPMTGTRAKARTRMPTVIAA